MPVYSMTGYASATVGAGATSETGTIAEGTSPQPAGAAGASITVEVRSVNGRFLDLSFRMPDEFRSLEPALRDLLGASLRRGKVELRLSTKADSDTAWPQPQVDQLSRLGRLENTIQSWMPKAQPLSVHEVLQWCKAGGISQRLDDVALDAAKQAVSGLTDARAREGERLVKVLMARVTRLRELAAEAEPLVPAVVQRQQQKFLERWRDALEAVGAAQTIARETLHERAVNEAASYAIRIDVAEELARLRAHLDEIERLLKKGGEVGKRLDFLIQELLREANTLGSKSSTLELTNVSVEMKVAIEQLREQVQNLE